MPPGKYETTDINLMLQSFLPKDVKVNITIDDIRLKSDLNNNKAIRFTQNFFFYAILGFTESHPGVLGDITSFIQLIPGSYKSNKPINITGVDEL